MGIDRETIHRGECLCDLGEFVVEECEPDHMFARPDQRWYEGRIECSECEKEYQLAEQGNEFVVVTNGALDRSGAAS